MSLLATLEAAAKLPVMSREAVAKVRELERASLLHAQAPIVTHHLIHAGLYARTIMIPAGVMLTGALIKRATVLIVDGDATVATGGEPMRLTGHHVIPASAHRKQAFLAHADTHLTMIFPTKATSVEAAEEEFTDEADMLISRRGENIVVITGE